ncbi:hypothetical protein JD844_006182 [Phrynosoma platyrhinos]|uniref:Uncharacterized protein n=1 Tax=Phrynosoma platyrhinos TaxID=52577 RepID=A0ABQ7T1R0_PHRPL|nr:hypothetical protein JD844_006182 [Phrynosoma platyrhinos]
MDHQVPLRLMDYLEKMEYQILKMISENQRRTVPSPVQPCRENIGGGLGHTAVAPSWEELSISPPAHTQQWRCFGGHGGGLCPALSSPAGRTSEAALDLPQLRQAGRSFPSVPQHTHGGGSVLGATEEDCAQPCPTLPGKHWRRPWTCHSCAKPGGTFHLSPGTHVLGAAVFWEPQRRTMPRPVECCWESIRGGLEPAATVPSQEELSISPPAHTWRQRYFGGRGGELCPTLSSPARRTSEAALDLPQLRQARRSFPSLPRHTRSSGGVLGAVKEDCAQPCPALPGEHQRWPWSFPSLPWHTHGGSGVLGAAED